GPGRRRPGRGATDRGRGCLRRDAPPQVPSRRGAPRGRGRAHRRARRPGAVAARAEARQPAAEDAYDEMRHRKYPRGEARRAVEAERTAARDDAAQARRNLDSRLDQPGRGGAPPGSLRAAEAPPAAPDVSDVEAADAADLPTDAPTADDDTEGARAADLPYETPVEGD